MSCRSLGKEKQYNWVLLVAGKKLKIGLVPALKNDISIASLLGHIGEIQQLTEMSDIKELKFDLIVIGDNIGINPYSLNINGYSQNLTDPVAHRFLHKHLSNILSSKIKVVGVGEGAVNLYAALGLKVSIGGPKENNVVFEENSNIEYDSHGNTFVSRNAYGMLEYDAAFWERIILDCFNDPEEGVLVTVPKQPITPSWDE